MKADFKKELKELYNPKAGAFSLVKVPKLQYLMVDGQGDPNKVIEYQEAVEALFSVSYTLKFHSKNGLGKDYVVPPLEGLWWSDDFDDFRSRRKNKWSWTMMIMVPEWLGKKEFKDAVSTVRSKKPGIKVERLRLESLNEGLSAQIMHIGSYDEETPTLLKLHDEWLPENGLKERLRTTRSTSGTREKPLQQSSRRSCGSLSRKSKNRNLAENGEFELPPCCPHKYSG